MSNIVKTRCGRSGNVLIKQTDDEVLGEEEMKVLVQGMLPLKTLKSFRKNGKQWRPEMKDKCKRLHWLHKHAKEDRA